MTDRIGNFVVLPLTCQTLAGNTTLSMQKQLPGRIGKYRSKH
jgi:hypothetical protein